jgi:hypothetical protein
MLVWIGWPATGDVVYKYTGNPFTTVTSPYTTSDFVSGTIQLPSVLPPNQTEFSPTLDGYSFSDGVQDTFTQTNSQTTNTFDVNTDQNGRITNWNFDLVSFQLAGHINTDNNIGLGQRDEGDERAILYIRDAAMGEVDGNPGTWTLVPEPSTAFLLATGMVALAVRRHRARGASV